MKVCLFLALALFATGCAVSPDIAFEDGFGMTAEFNEPPEKLVPLKGDECCAERNTVGSCSKAIPQCVPWAKAPIDNRPVTRR